MSEAVLQVIENVFERDSIRRSAVEPGAPLLSYVPDELCQPNLRMVHNGHMIEPDDSVSVDLADGDELTLYLAPADPTGGFILSSLISAAVITGVSLGVQAIVRPKDDVERDATTSTTYGFNGIENTTSPQTRIPVVYGRHRFGGQIIQQYFSTLGVANPETVLNTELGISIGPIQSISQPRVNKNLATGRTVFGYELGFQVQTPQSPSTAFFGSSATTLRQTTVVEKVLTFSGGPITQQTPDETETIEIVVRFPRGLYFLHGDGRVTDRTVGINVSATIPGGTTTYNRTFAIKRRIATSFDVILSLDVEQAIYDVTLTRTTEDFSTTSQNVGDTEWEALQSVINDGFSYPYLSRAAVRQFPDEVSSGRAEYDFLVEGCIVKVFSDTTTYTEQFSRNPAWILYDFLTSKYRGLGNYIAESDLVIQDFLDWGTFCDQQVVDPKTTNLVPRFECDIVVDESFSAIDAIKQICIAGRANFVKRGSKWGVVIEDALAGEPKQLFQMTRISRDTFTLQKTSRRKIANYLIGQFPNAELDYEIDPLPKEDETLLEGSDTIERTINLTGVTRVDQAERLLNYFSKANRLSRRTIEFETDAEAIISEPGDVIRVSHDVTQVGVSGKIRAFQDSVVTLDREVTQQIGFRYELTVYFPDGPSVEVLRVQFVQGTSDRVTLITTPTSTIVSGFHYSFGPIENSTNEYRIQSISQGSVSSKRRIRAKEYDSRVYDDTELDPKPDPIITTIDNPFLIPANPSEVTLLETQVEQVDGTLSAALNVFFERPLSFRPRVEVFFRQEGDDWESAGISESTYLRIENVQSPGIVYEVSVVSLALNGDRNSPDLGTIETITTSVSTRQPANVTNLRGDRVQGGYLFMWDKLPATDIAYYEIRRGDEWDTALIVGRAPGTDDQLSTPEIYSGIQQFLIKAFNTVGNESKQATAFIVDIPGRPNPNIVIQQSEDPSWSGTLSKFNLVSQTLVLDPQDEPVAFRARNTSVIGSVRPGGFGQQEIALTGSYTTAKIQVTTGDPVRAYVYSELNAVISDLTRTWTGPDTGGETWTGPFGASNTWVQDVPGKASFKVEWRFSTNTNSESDFGPWAERSQAVEVDVKWAQARIVADIKDPTFQVTVNGWELFIDVIEVTLSGTVSTSASQAVSVSFSKTFNQKPEIVPSIVNGSAGDTWRITNASKTGFDIESFDAAETRVARTVDWIVRGF